jgi:hypothetical protein
MPAHPSVESYFDALAQPLQPVAHAARAAVDAAFGTGPDGTDGTTGSTARTCRIRWSHPTWSIGKDPVCYLRTATHHLIFGFWKGASLHDSTGRLESTGQVMAHAKLQTIEDIDTAVIIDWVHQALTLHQAH